MVTVCILKPSPVNEADGANASIHALSRIGGDTIMVGYNFLLDGVTPLLSVPRVLSVHP